MTAATRSLINNAREAARILRCNATIAESDGWPYLPRKDRQLADQLDRDAAAVEAELAVVIGTDDDDEPELGPLDGRW